MPSFERRKYERVNLESKIEYVLNHTDEVFLEGEIVNLSQFGLCFNTYIELREGEEIIFKDNLPNDYQTAMVVWIEKTAGNYYMVGAQFK
jgi:c-di-GMP-binding flagellar brake protein YcgR